MENIAQGRDEWARSLVMLKLFVESLKALDQVGYLFSGIRPSGWLAEMRAAAEGAVLVNRAFSVHAEEWTGVIGVGLQFHPARGTHAFGCKERLCHRHEGSHAGETKATAACSERTFTLEGPPLDLGINIPQFGFEGGI